MKYISHRAIICTLTLLIIIITVLFTFLRSSDVPEYMALLQIVGGDKLIIPFC